VGISRLQVWQWPHNDIVLADTDQVVSRELVERILDEDIARAFGEPGDYVQARHVQDRRHCRRLRRVSHPPGL
jgi:malate synthase